MNREIKFRNAFLHKDGSFSHFAYWGAINHKGQSSLDDSCFASPSQSNGLSKQWHQQFTGLLDKNGKEIYEGDIVVTKYQKKAIVEWDKENACFCTTTIDDIIKDERLYCLKDITEIIGNTYENPELLK